MVLDACKTLLVYMFFTEGLVTLYEFLSESVFSVEPLKIEKVLGG